MENQKKVQSVESVNDYIGLHFVAIQVIKQISHAFFVSWQLLLDSASVAHQFMPLIIRSIKKLF
jgi:hypothetical protein